MLEVGADVLVIDSSQGDSVFQVDLVKQLKSAYPNTQVSQLSFANETLLPLAAMAGFIIL